MPRKTVTPSSSKLTPEEKTGTFGALYGADPATDTANSALAKKGGDFSGKVSALVVKDQKSYDGAAAMLTDLARLRKEIDGKRVEFTKPLNEHVKKINAYFKGLSDPLERAETELKRKLLTYRAEQDRIALEEQRKRDAEAAEAAAKAQAARDRAASLKTKRAQDKALAEAEVLSSEALEAATRTVAAPVAKTVSAGTGAVTAKKVWTFEVVSAESVPRTYLTVDESAIRAAVRAGVREIAGVRIFEDEQMSVRA